MDFKRQLYEYKSGLKLVFVKTPDFNTAKIKIMFMTGAEDEVNPTGLAHLVEHTIFKGTASLSQEDISERFNVLSAEVDAFTSSEFTSYKATFPKRNIEEVLKLYSHILSCSTFNAELLDKEKQVILEEIMMHEDNPDQLSFDNLVKLMYSDNGIGNDIAGEVEHFNSVTRDMAYKFYKERYHSKNMLVSVVGDFEFNQVIELVDKHINKVFTSRGRAVKKWSAKSSVKPKSKVVYKDINQANIVMGFKTVPYTDYKRLEIGLIGFILGGSMSSRLFKRIRNELSLCYSVYAFEMNYKNNGFLGVSLATSAENADMAIGAVNEEILKIINNGVSDEEFETAKNLTIDKHMMNQDYPNVNLYYLAYQNRLLDKDEIVSYLRGIDKETALRSFKEFIHPNKAFISVVTNKN